MFKRYSEMIEKVTPRDKVYCNIATLTKVALWSSHEHLLIEPSKRIKENLSL